jgi:cyanophycinase-like exopeptidase
MEVIGVTDCRMIRSSFLDEDQLFFESADIILLAGGDVEKGWDVIERVGIKEALCRRYQTGAVLLGVSAGAVQLGQYGFREENGMSTSLFDTLKLVPFAVDVHQEQSGWERLRAMIRVLDSGVTGLGIPSGGGVIYHPDHTIEPVRFPVYVFAMKDQALTRTLVFPAKGN